MKITEVRIFQKESDDKKLRAFATVTFDDSFVVRDIKIIEGSRGYFVAMPSRRVKEPCPRCHHRNVVRARYCNQCGAYLDARNQFKNPSEGEQLQSRERQSEHRDIAHPITAAFRETIQKAVLDAYDEERTKLGEKVSSNPDSSEHSE